PDSEARERAFQYARTGLESTQQHASDCLPTASGDVHRETAYFSVSTGNWPAIWRQAPHHRAPLDQQDRGDAPFGQRFEPDDHTSDGYTAVVNSFFLSTFNF